MKRNFTLLLAFLLVSSLSLMAQSNRMLMVEEGTQASCGPCAAQNPAFDALLDANADKVVVLKYQTSWPGFDQMNLDNPEEVQDRVDYYGIDGVPSGFVNGIGIVNDCNAYDTAPACLSQADIDAAYAEISPFDMTISADVDVNNLMTITGSVTSTSAVSAGDLRLRIAITEKSIAYEDVPGGTNGETSFHHVMKKFVGGTSGFALSADWVAGDTYEINETFDLNTITVYNLSELEVVAFVQDDTDKFVHQATRDAAVNVVVEFDVNSAVTAVTNIPTTICSGAQNFTPVVTLQNTGNDNLTSATFVYSVGGEMATYEWAGMLETYQKENVELDAVSFDAVPGEPTMIEVEVTNPNGVEDMELSDNNTSAQLINASTENTLELTIRTDDYGHETYWAILNLFGQPVFEGGNLNVGLNGGGSTVTDSSDPGAYGDGVTVVENIELEEMSCYEFVIVDAYGDGICCSYGNGYAILKNSLGDVIMEMGQFTTQDRGDFSNTTISNVEAPEVVAEFSINPNPVNDIAVMNFNMVDNAKATVTVMDATGRAMLEQNLGVLSSGAHTREIDMAGLANGVYFVRLNAGNNIVTKKITLVK